MYDFDKVVNRYGTNSLKWNVKENELPMWVADMDFETAPEIKEALLARVAHGVFGYTDIPEEWAQSYVDWWSNRHHYEMDKESLIFCTGVVPAISSMVRKLTTPAEKVLIQTPVYNIFFNSILNNGRQVLQSPLAYDKKSFEIDFEKLERDLADPQTSLMILCNPHNPIGKIWDRETLAKIGDLCEKYNVTVISDEIHCDLVAPGLEYVPFACASEVCKNISITCIAPTKAFNIAGLQTAAVSIPNKNLRHKVWRGLNTDEVAEPNAFAVNAAIAAFTKGANWLDELRNYMQINKNTAREYIQNHLSDLYVIPSEATYLLWIDCSKITKDTQELADFIREKTGLYLSEGSQYGANGNEFLRLNVACTKECLLDGLERLKDGVLKYQTCKK